MGDLYTGTKLETADTAKSALHTTAPAPDPTVASWTGIGREQLARALGMSAGRPAVDARRAGRVPDGDLGRCGALEVVRR
jgi:hypothetical protein